MALHAPELLRVTSRSETGALKRAADLITAGGLAIIPTDTVYGLAADARVDEAKDRIRTAKGRAAGKPIPLLAAGIEEIMHYGGRLNRTERALADRFWPGPLTLVLSMAHGAPERNEGFRVPDHEVALALLGGVGGVMRVTSANRSGSPPALCAKDAIRELGECVAVVIDAGVAPGGTASTVVKVLGDRLRILRHGALPESAFSDLGLDVYTGEKTDA